MRRNGKPQESRARRIERVKAEHEAQPIVLSTGVVVKAKGVSPFVVNAAMAKIEKPKVPVQFIDSKGRDEENPMHPEYLAGLAQYEADRSRVAQEAMLLLGVEVLSIPDGFEAADGSEWVDTLAFLDVQVSPNGQRRKLDRLRYWAMRSVDDLQRVATAVSRASGVPEQEVEKAAESFRGDEAQ